MAKRKIGQPGSGDVTGIHYYDPSSVKEVIESRLRRQRHTATLFREMAKESRPDRQFKKGTLGLKEVELAAIRQEAASRFLDGAKLSEALREQRQGFRENFHDRVESFSKNADREISDLAELHAVLFSRDCERAVEKATGDFADMLTQAVISRRGRKDFSLKLCTEVWAECLRFALRLARFETAGAWIDNAWGTSPREGALPHLSRLESVREQRAEVAKFLEKFRPKFEERIRHGSPQWLDEAGRRMELRCLLSSAPERRGSLDDPSKKAVALLLTASPRLTTEQVCGKLDSKNETSPRTAPIPKAWQKCGARSWNDAFKKFRGRVKTYVSTVRKQAGIAQGPSEKGLAPLARSTT